VNACWRCAPKVHSNEVRVAHNEAVLAVLAVVLLAFPHGTAVIRTPSHTVTAQVEIARTPAQREQGLMGRTTLARNAGMVFLFSAPTRVRFWMKDTLIPLSIAFWNKRGRIVRILDMAPCRADPCKLYDPGVAFSGALEVNRGAFRRWGVRPGARITVRG
jgi:uncharacterized membrane protein (UPF0127 family)